MSFFLSNFPPTFIFQALSEISFLTHLPPPPLPYPSCCSNHFAIILIRHLSLIHKLVCASWTALLCLQFTSETTALYRLARLPCLSTCPTCYVLCYVRSCVNPSFIRRHAVSGAAGGAKLIHFLLSKQVLPHLQMT